MDTNKTQLQYAKELDAQDDLKNYKAQFHIPIINNKPAIYFCGNSLGLKPKTTNQAVLQELEDWEKFGVEGHFHGRNPWFGYHKFLTEKAAKVVGAKPPEVVIMNSLTVNLHLMMVSFYQPTAQRFKIIMEGGAFPSDQYAMESQAEFHGFDPEEAIIEIHPREGEHTLRTEDIIATIEQHKDDLALVMMGGVNYYTGQLYDMKTITKTAHEVGAFAGYDLAHAAGNAMLNLHDWEVDFAVWCTYKYLNSGPGGTSGAFVHEKHGNNPKLPRFAGWWGHNEEERFLMKKGFQPMEGAEGWQLSNAQILPMAAHKASLEIFDEVGMPALVEKSRKLTAYLWDLVQHLNTEQDKVHINIITPENQEDRGCQLSLVLSAHGKYIFEEITKKGVIADWREPDVIRVAPVPLYNSFEDVYLFYRLIKEAITELN